MLMTRWNNEWRAMNFNDERRTLTDIQLVEYLFRFVRNGILNCCMFVS